jgi:hypothetical protein
MKYFTGAVSLFIFIIVAAFSTHRPQDMPFGGQDDVKFAKDLWQAVNGYDSWLTKSDYYEGNRPHGKILRNYFSIVTVNGKNYPAIIKDNFAGEGASLTSVSENPNEYLVAVTIMVKRSDGYDPDNQNWFWVKYKPDGTIDKNKKGISLAGRVAKGMDSGCINCHSIAKGSDYYFSNDK